jgi:putative endonuclease
MGNRAQGSRIADSIAVVPAQAGTHKHRLSFGMPYFVYILASRRHGTLYIGITNNLSARLEQHRNGFGSKFVKKYSVYRLVYTESYESAEDAIRREKQLKKWNRDWKIRLIEEDNPEWRDRTALLT